MYLHLLTKYKHPWIAFTLILILGCYKKLEVKINKENFASGLKIEVIKKGIGVKSEIGDDVIIDEQVSYLNGQVLYASEGHNNLPRFKLGGGQAIKGVDEGVLGMEEGEVRKLTIPPHLSLRTNYPKEISQDSTLVYIIELKEVIKPKEQFVEKRKSGFQMVKVKGGKFIMGGRDDVDDGGDYLLRLADECPHEVMISDFSIGKYEVTQADWISVMEENPSHHKYCLQCPVERVSWVDIQKFLKKLNKGKEIKYRLPNEEEWEYAAKGGLSKSSFKYSGSNFSRVVSWFNENSEQSTQHIGRLLSNQLGIYDMSGNVLEWCSNAKTPYPCDSLGKKFNTKMIRGGSFSNRSESVRVIDRNARDPSTKLQTIGFRLVVSH